MADSPHAAVRSIHRGIPCLFPCTLPQRRPLEAFPMDVLSASCQTSLNPAMFSAIVWQWSDIHFRFTSISTKMGPASASQTLR